MEDSDDVWIDVLHDFRRDAILVRRALTARLDPDNARSLDYASSLYDLQRSHEYVVVYMYTEPH